MPTFSHFFRHIFLSVENRAGVWLIRDLAELVVDDRTPIPDFFFPLSFAIRLVPSRIFLFDQSANFVALLTDVLDRMLIVGGEHFQLSDLRFERVTQFEFSGGA